jgi:Flp pilus assembly protein TadD
LFVLSARGTAFGKSGHYQLALDDFNHALALNPGNTSAYMNRANVYVALKDRAAACKDRAEGSERGDRRAANMIQQYCR